MSNENLKLNTFPKAHVKPYDGMPVTADIWAQSHEEHRHAMLAHDLVFHGAGIVCGLEVTANDPPDQYVFISPGAAVDPVGKVIVVPEPVAYDFGSAVEGDLYLMVGHGEREVEVDGSDVHVLQDEFVIAARSSLPKRPAVELGRVRVSKQGTAIRNASSPNHPKMDEIDLRYRVELRPTVKKVVKAAVVSLGNPPADILDGWDALAHECMRSTDFQLVIEPYPSAGAAMAGGAGLIYLAACGSFKVEASLVKDLAAFVESGKGLIVDAYDEGAAEEMTGLLQKVDGSLKDVSAGHRLQSEPYLFVEVPGTALMAGKRSVYAREGLALAWAGKRTGFSSRESIRSAHEWGVNIVSYCLRSGS